MSVWNQCAYQSALSFENFPYQLMLTKNVKKLVPADDFGHNVGGLFDQEQKIYVTLTEYSPRSTEQFSQTRKSGTRQGNRQEHGWEGQTWDISPKSRIFALWCATRGCRISREILLDMQLTSQLRFFFRFHVQFTTWRILFEMGGIQSVSALPWELMFG